MASAGGPSSKASTRLAGAKRKLLIHGAPVELECLVPGLDPTLGRLFGAFDVGNIAPVGAIRGVLKPYDSAEVVRRLPTAAKALHRPGDLTEIYCLDERSWIIDERWGMAEINFMRGQWQSWVLGQSALDPVRLTDLAVFWPLAQLLKGRGVHLTPGLSVARGDFAGLVLCPFGLEYEMAALLVAGYGILGQRWSALRDSGASLDLLKTPGMVPDPRGPKAVGADGWVDLTANQTHLIPVQAACDVVLIIDPGRRPRPALSAWSQADAAMVLRLSWPLPELHPTRRHAQLALRIAQLCQCFQLQLSRNPKDLLGQLEALRSQSAMRRRAA